MNRNVWLTLVQTALIGLASGIWCSTIQVAFVYVMQGNNADVGLVEMAYGMAQLLSAYPVGYISDKHGRSPILKVCGLLCIAATVATSYVVWEVTESDPAWGYWAFFACMAMWGILGGVSSGPGQALYADSIPKGERTRFYMYLQVAWMLSGTVGPVVNIALFTEYGNGWTLHEMRTVMLVGLAVEMVSAVPSFFFTDKLILSEEEKKEEEDADGIRRATYIPHIMLGSAILVALGSGMTVKFFPLFFKNQLHLTPVDVQIVYICNSLATAALSGLGTLLARRIGRVEAILTVSFIGIGALVVLALLYDRLGLYGTVAVYVARCALMNAPYPVEEAIMMDSVPRDQRARWKSLESVAIAGWCGSAALGGYLIDRYSYSVTFVITAILQTVGFLPLLWIRSAVKQEKQIATDETEPLLINQ